MNRTLVSDNIFWMELNGAPETIPEEGAVEIIRRSSDLPLNVWWKCYKVTALSVGTGEVFATLSFFWSELDVLTFVFVVIGEKVYYNLWNQRLLSTFVIQSLVKCYHKMIGLITRSVLWYYPNIGTSTLSDNWIVDSERSHTCFCYIPVYLHRGIFKIKGCELLFISII